MRGKRQKETHSLLLLDFYVLAKEIFQVLLLDRIKEQFWLISILFLRLISLKILLLRMSLCCRQSYKKSGIGVHQCTSELGTWFKTQRNISILSPMSTTGKDGMGYNKVMLISSKRKWKTKLEHVDWKKNYSGVIELYISKESFWEVVDVPRVFCL